MPLQDLRAEIAAGVDFWGIHRDGELISVMGLQPVKDVSLIRHAYTRTAAQGLGAGTALLEHLRAQAGGRLLVGTWKAATWAIRFYEKRGFNLVSEKRKSMLLREYWDIPDRQIEESVVLVFGEQ